jgi:hypothetical protein|tara:strand:- start:848 stop:3121 length:2274 start_codon:yes stop_codon:yes gene_type:complete
MAEVKFLADINLNKNQLTNVTLQHIAGDPSGGTEAYEGRAFYDSTNKVIKFHNGTAFVALTSASGDVTGVGAGAGLTGTDLNGPVPTLNVIAGTGITVNADSVQITNGGVDTTQLADDAVTADKLANAINTAIAANTAKNTNVSTNLSVASSTTSRIIASSDGTNATIPVATTSVSGVMSTTIFDEHTANKAKATNATHSGDVTGSGALTIAADAVTYAKMQNLGTANRVLGSTSTGVIGEVQIVEAMIADDAVTADKIANSVNSAIAANTAKSTNVSTNLSVASSTGSRIIASSDGTNATIPVATTSVSGVMSTAIFDAVAANTAKSTNTDVDVSNANLLTKLAALESAGGAANQNIVIGTDSGDTVVITGNLQVAGATTTVNSETVSTADNNIVLASGNSTGAVLDATGLTFEGGTGDDVTLQWLASGTTLELKKGSSYANMKLGVLAATTLTGALTGNVTGNASGSAGTVTSIGNLTGDVTSSNRATTIAADAVTYAKMQNLATANRVLGSTSTGVIGEVQIVEAMIANDAVTADKLANSINTAIAANTSKSTNVSTNLSGTTHASQYTVNSSDGNNVTIAEASGTIAGVMTVAHHDKLDGIESSATADQSKSDIEGLAIQTVGAITSGSWTSTDIAVAHGGTGASSASAARTNLGVAYASDAQALAGSVDTVVLTPGNLAARSYRETVGNGSLTTINIDHDLGTRDVMVQLYDASSYETIYAQVTRSTTARVVLVFNVAPTTDDVIVLVNKID